jgi:hypothetical protein
MAVREFDFERFNLNFSTGVKYDSVKDIMRDYDKDVMERVTTAIERHATCFHTITDEQAVRDIVEDELKRVALTESRVREIARLEMAAKLADHRLGCHASAPDPPDGVWVEPGDVVRHSVWGKQSIAKDQTEASAGISITVFGRRVTTEPLDLWEANLMYLTTLDGQPVLGVRE